MFLNGIAEIPGSMNQMETLIDKKRIEIAEEEAQRTLAEVQKEQGRLEMQADRERQADEGEEGKSAARNE